MKFLITKNSKYLKQIQKEYGQLNLNYLNRKNKEKSINPSLLIWVFRKLKNIKKIYLNLNKINLKKSDIEIFNWIHSTFGNFSGTRSELRDNFPNEKIKVAELAKVINPAYPEKSYHGWKLI